MKKTLATLSAGLLMGSAVQAAVTVTQPLSGPTSGGIQTNTTVVTTNVTDASGATFDIVFTLGSIGAGSLPQYNAGTGTYGVATTTDANANHNGTIDGDDGEGISFTGLAIANFADNGSGFTAADFTNLTFSSVSFGVVGNNQDGVNFSFTDFPTHPTIAGGSGASENQGLDDTDGFSAGVANPFPLTNLTTFTAPATDLFLRADNQATSNRFNLSALQVTYLSPIPEPSSTAFLGLAGIALILRRRK